MPNCKNCHNQFEITDTDRAFYKKISVTEPTLCPDCRETQRLSFRNERYYYQNKCNSCGKTITSVYDPSFHQNVYCHKCWWSEKFDGQEFGVEFNFNKGFFEQYQSLLERVPKLAMMNDNGTGSENSEYTYDVSRCKNAYLVIGSWHVQDCSYGFQINHVRDCIDNFFVNESELMYNCAMCEKCYNCQDLAQCTNCKDCIFGYDLRSCKDCLMCAALQNKQYCILNQQYSKEEYNKIKQELNLGSWNDRLSQRERFLSFLLTIPRKYANLVNCENCTGDNLISCKNCQSCFFQRNMRDCKWMSSGDGATDCYDCWSTGGPELCYNCITPDLSYNVIFGIYCWKTKYAVYSENCHSSENIFGCVGLKRKKFCVLNKQYSPEEYQKVKDQIVTHMQQTGEWGEFFPSHISPFAYNETTAHEWYPLEQNQAKEAGYRWQQKLPGVYEKQTIAWQNVPQDIADIDDSYAQHVFSCINCHKNYKIQTGEINFYKRNNIPLPRLCIDCRYNLRKRSMNPRQLYSRTCAKCSTKIQSTYAPSRSEIIYCEKCYLETVY